MKRLTRLAMGFAAAFLMVPAVFAADLTSGMTQGDAGLKSAGPLAFGPDGILFVADTKSAAIVAIATGDTKPGATDRLLKVESMNTKIAAMLGTSADQILVNDMAVNPVSRSAYLAISRGRGPDAIPVIVRAKSDGSLEVLATENVKFSRSELSAAPADAPAAAAGANRQPSARQESITDLAYMDGNVVVAGLSNEEFASTLRSLPFPFATSANPTSVEIFHGAHGRFETRAPVRTFVEMNIDNQPQLLAAYTCTPLVQFSPSEIKPGAKIKGKTVAELGNRNRPIDMISYQKDGKDYLLLANSSRGVMKIYADQISKAEPISAPVQTETKGVGYEAVAWTGIDQLDRLDASHALVVRRGTGDVLSLEALPLP